jgi:hypothetical protein
MERGGSSGLYETSRQMYVCLVRFFNVLNSGLGGIWGLVTKCVHVDLLMHLMLQRLYTVSIVVTNYRSPVTRGCVENVFELETLLKRKYLKWLLHPDYLRICACYGYQTYCTVYEGCRRAELGMLVFRKLRNRRFEVTPKPLDPELTAHHILHLTQRLRTHASWCESYYESTTIPGNFLSILTVLATPFIAWLLTTSKNDALWGALKSIVMEIMETLRHDYASNIW